MIRWLAVILIIAGMGINLEAQTVKTERIYSGKMENMQVPDALEYLTGLTGFRFAFTASVNDPDERISFYFHEMNLKDLLIRFSHEAGFEYSFFGDQILLKKKDPVPLRLQGIIIDQDSMVPVPYVAVFFKNTLSGTISDVSGKFELEAEGVNVNDTLVFASMGYGQKEVPVRFFSDQKITEIRLSPQVYKIEAAHISSRDFKKMQVGNHQKIPHGSLYLDTHGQQAALFVENEKKVTGKILSVNFFLSSKGNTEAPFRVRIYSADSLTGAPADDLLPVMLIVKPGIKKGWFRVDVRDYDLQIPGNGFFIAMEGIYPNDFSFYAGDNGFVDLSPGDEVTVADDDDMASITYGQRLGYTRSKKDKNNTWHYSLSHTWFQLKKQPFGLMVSADIRVRKEKKKKIEK